MKRQYLYTLVLLVCVFFTRSVSAQIVSGNLFLQGKFSEIGAQVNGSLGAPYAPTGYHPHSGAYVCSSSSNTLAMVFDYGYDGWTTGSPPFMGDYTLPGSPWEAWAIEVGGTACYAHSTSCAFTGTLTGAWTSYTNTGGRALGYWSGTTASGALAIKKEYRIDTLASCLVVTCVFTNTTASTLTGIYYLRSCDPDNSQSWGGSFTTINNIVYQNDYLHRVMVTATATGSSSGTPPQPLSLCTKDCRAKAIIYNAWPISSSCLLSNLWAGSTSCVGTMYTATNSAVTGDIAIGLLYHVCDIPAYDSASISYAYVFNGSGGVDNAFPDPKMVINGTTYDSAATLTACTGAFSDTLPVNIINAIDKNWKGSTWTWAPATALTSTTGVTSSVIIHSLTGTITYTITGSDTGRGCGTCNRKTFYLTIIPTTFGPPGVSDVYYCQGDYATPLTASGVNILWYTTATGGVGSGTAPTPSTSTPGNTTYWVTQMPCPPTESARAAITVHVTAAPVVIAANNGPICAGDSLKLFGVDTFTTGTIVYSWSGPGGFTSTSHNPVIPNAAVTDSGVYTVVLSVNGCVSTPSTTLAVVHYTPPAPTVSTVTYCQYETSVPLSATGSNILWYYPTATSLYAGTPTPSTSAPGVFNYYATQTLNGCESPRAAYVVTINPKPSIPVLGAAPTYCQYDYPSPLTATGSNMLWYGPGVSGSTTAPTPNTSTAHIDTYYVTQTLLGCVSDRAMQIVTVIAKPSAPVVSDTSYCQYSTAAQLTAGGVNLKWYTVSAGGSALTTGAPTPSTATVGTTTWYVSQTVNGCESDRSAISVTILYLPSFTISESRNFVCQYDTLSFNYNGPGLTGPVFHWIMPNGASYVTGDSTTPGVVVKFDSLYFQTIILSVGSYSGRCTTTDTLKIHVVPEPTADAYIKENICENDTITLALSSRSSNADNFTWDFDGGTVITASSSTGGPYKVSWTTPGIKIVKYRSVTVEGCLGKEVHDTVKVHAIPDATIITTAINGIICLEDSVSLSGRDDDQSHTYRWTPEHFFNNNNRHKIWGKIETVGYVTLTVTDAFGCKASDSVFFNPESCCKVAFPTAFTPNGDGKNDVFRPIFDGYHRFHNFRIVNRWGQTVFESTNSRCEWDGTFGGVPQDMGVYYFFIKYDCDDNGKTGSKERIEKGEVTLIR